MSSAMPEVRYYSRFSLPQRYLHGVLVATFLGLALTGLPLRFSSQGWSVNFANTVGGFGTILFFHKLFGLTLTVAFLIHLGNILFRVIARKEYGLLWGPNSMVPRWKDITDLFANIRYFFWLGPQPKFDRYTYWDKMDYWAVFWGMGIIGMSGFAMWFAPFFARFVPGSWLNIALLIHGEEAILAVSFIFTIHFFNTHLRPQNFPMDLIIFTGNQTEEELREKHPEEYERLLRTGELERLRSQPPPKWLINFGRLLGTAAILTGFVLLYFTAVSFFKS
jgi:cytochrome b subunit of formate dehydrogenase